MLQLLSGMARRAWLRPAGWNVVSSQNAGCPPGCTCPGLQVLSSLVAEASAAAALSQQPCLQAGLGLQLQMDANLTALEVRLLLPWWREACALAQAKTQAMQLGCPVPSPISAGQC